MGDRVKLRIYSKHPSAATCKILRKGEMLTHLNFTDVTRCHRTLAKEYEHRLQCCDTPPTHKKKPSPLSSCHGIWQCPMEQFLSSISLDPRGRVVTKWLTEPLVTALCSGDTWLLFFGAPQSTRFETLGTNHSLFSEPRF